MLWEKESTRGERARTYTGHMRGELGSSPSRCVAVSSSGHQVRVFEFSAWPRVFRVLMVSWNFHADSYGYVPRTRVPRVRLWWDEVSRRWVPECGREAQAGAGG